VRRACGWCRKWLGVRCPACGTDGEHLPLIELGLCASADCSVIIFKITEETTGICRTCADRMLGRSA